ncbi:MAG: ATP-binding protein [Candidatus Krumholzibacteria bacterium]|nr:ATP-binding protein [Candidatus Krumholzibacteria bacterium]
MFSRFVAVELANTKIGDEKRNNFIREARGTLDVPYVITDAGGRPVTWSQIGIEALSLPGDYGRLLNFDPASPKDPVLARVLDKMRAFDRINPPIPIKMGETQIVLHYGASALSRELAIAPYVQLGVLVIFALFGFLGFRALKTGEQRSIWIGMAKETAHQLGTPLSSIMGWLSLMREEMASAPSSEKIALAVDELSIDIDRLSKISERFSKIGSAPKLELQEFAPIVEETVAYFERRRPSLKINSTITTDIEELPLIRCSRELIGWVLENMIKNALDAIAGDEGKIHIECRMNEKDKRIELRFSDNGKGMSPGVRKRIFSPGFTTKSRGWGLGLSLVKRIVEDIHGGSIRVLQTQPGKGTTFLVTLPVD